MENKLNMVDLFCGAGIGAMGFKKAGFNIIDAIDNKQYAVDTYNINIKNVARAEDIKKIKSKDIPFADLYVAGFPCQPFSLGGKGEGIDDKNLGNLGFHTFRIIRDNMPNAFILENVKGIISKKHEKFFNYLIEQFEEIGYNIKWELINCYDYGIPQLRERVFVVGINRKLNKDFIFPNEVSDSERKTLRDSIYDIKNDVGKHTIKNHDIYYDGGFSSRYVSRNRQKQWDEPSFTIVSTARQLPLYPEPSNYDIRLKDQDLRKPPRRFTVRECLRIQSVPDEFYFPDYININNQYERCSGIPSLFAYKMGKQIYKILNNT
jgi:DNA (cytosine-5)-methyltransferase 1